MFPIHFVKQIVGKELLLIDTAGIRKKSKISQTLEKYSVVQALKSINRYTKRIGTSQLNDLVEKSVQRNPMACYANRQMHISYATQTDVKTPTFVLFVSNTKSIHFSYERYLTNQIRETFGFDSVPLKLVFRKKRSLNFLLTTS